MSIFIEHQFLKHKIKDIKGLAEFIDLMNLGYFPMMLSERVPSPNVLSYETGVGGNIFANYKWVIHADPNNEYECERYFGCPFRKTKVYLTRLYFKTYIPVKDAVNLIHEFGFYVTKEIDGTVDYILDVWITEDQMTEGVQEWDYPIDPPVEVPINLGFSFDFWFYLQSLTAGNECGMSIFQCRLESKLKL